MGNTLSGWWSAMTSAAGNIFRRLGVQTASPQSYIAPAAAPVTLDSAMQVSAFWSCVRLIAETIGSLPFVMYERQGDVRTVVADHPLALLFADRVNRYQSRQEFFETLALNLATSGNAFTLIQRAGEKIVGLLPLMSGQVEVKSLPGGVVVYCYQEDGAVRVFAEENIWHLKLFGNGIIGLSPLSYSRNSVGMAIAGEVRTGNLWRNGGKPTGVLLIDKVLKPEQREQLRAEFKELREGESDRLMVLEAGAKYETISLSPQDMELLDSRRFQIEDIARFLGVPSVLINDTSATTVWGSGISQIVAGWYKLGLRPYLERFQTGAKLKLFTPAERLKYEFEFDFRALLRIDPKDHMATLVQGVGNGLLTRNEARVELGKAPMEGADELTVQVNLAPLDALGRVVAPQGAPKPVEDEKSVPNVNVTVQLPAELKFAPVSFDMKGLSDAMRPSVVVNTPAPVVNVRSEAPVVNLPAPIVNIASPEVKVSMPEVQRVEIVSMPARQTTTTVKSDSLGNVTGSTSSEKDA